MTELQTEFDYQALEINKKDEGFLETRAQQIDKLQEKSRKTATICMLEMGKKLQEAHDRLANHKNGTFGKWVTTRCGMTRQSAYNAMNAQAALGNGYCQIVGQYFDQTACYELTADSCPEEALQDALARAQEGEPITAKLAKELRKSHGRQAESVLVENYDEDDEEGGEEYDEEEDDWGISPISERLDQVADIIRELAAVDKLGVLMRLKVLELELSDDE